MATSPPAPFPASLPNPKKRPSMSSQPSGQSISKKPKLHPLRQTSFPADSIPAYASAVTSARSETGSITNSLVSATSAKRPRGRPRKSAQLQPEDLQEANQSQNDDKANLTVYSKSNVGGGARSVVSAKSGGVAEQDEEDEPQVEVDLNEQEKNEERRAEERQYRLVDTFDADQTARYASWRRLRLNVAGLRRLVNATVSQSVSANPLNTVNQFSKYFIGEIVERARDVQLEFAKAYEKTREEEMEWRKEKLKRLEEKQSSGVEDPNKLIARDIVRLRREVDEYIPNPHKAGLLPDHLREALRRYRADGEGGGAGFEGLSHGLLGTAGNATWRVGDGATGRRLFR